MIHPTAIVEDGAQLGADVEVGPYAHIGRNVKIGDGTRIAQGAIVDGHTTIGTQCQIFPYACIGMKTQDLKYLLCRDRRPHGPARVRDGTPRHGGRGEDDHR